MSLIMFLKIIFSLFRCQAKCKTTPDGRSIKFIDLNHNHGHLTGTMTKDSKRHSIGLSKASVLVEVKTESPI